MRLGSFIVKTAEISPTSFSQDLDVLTATVETQTKGDALRVDVVPPKQLQTILDHG
jgi:hypothetical protein